MRTKSSEEEIARALDRVPGWRREDDSIVRDLQFADFLAAIAFVNRVAEAAQSLDHHPDILIHGWNKVRLSSTTHDAGGLTSRDFALAALIEEIG
jgi:4a-hydroxytetrahydrobiopterin dehydratase